MQFLCVCSQSFYVILALRDRLSSERESFTIVVHVYLFGPKFKGEVEKISAKDHVVRTICESFGETIAHVSVRQVRDISTKNLQYCATFRMTNLDDTSKRIKLG